MYFDARIVFVIKFYNENLECNEYIDKTFYLKELLSLSLLGSSRSSPKSK